MAGGPAIPIIVGVGDIVNRSSKLEDALEPMELMLRAIAHALQDTGLSSAAVRDLQTHIDSIDVVSTWTWPYPDLPGQLADKLGVRPSHKLYSEYHGGNQPGKMVDNAARRISKREAKFAVVTGGEALASPAKKMPPPGWTKINDSVDSVFKPDLERMANTMGATHRVGLPIQVYPFYENAYRAKHGQSIRENMKESAKLYGDFAKVAEHLPTAWNYGKKAETEQSIGTVTKKNRMICFPCACLLTSTDFARELGIPESQWIYPLGGAGTADSKDFPRCRPSSVRLDERTNRRVRFLLVSCPSPSSYRRKLTVDSCFPIVPKLACEHFGLSPSHPAKPITLLGGLTSFGGAGNNYSMHAIIEMTRQFRAAKNERKLGLVLANGGTVTYQHVVCLSSQPRADGSPYPQSPPLPETSQGVSIPEIVEDVGSGQEAVVETYTIDFNRDNTPALGHVVGRLASGARFIANHADEGTLRQLASDTKEPIGRKGWVVRDAEEDRNLFSFEARAGL
ncbi:hypothetical protein FH972_026714 [Carpinus fangiana]|uniref:Thiolase-like protein type 1 additional C-terminal domain-containing protein n=1 Tax=Carpinus fangiana TaxID=176857 RepID=A0A5N6L530_9ROSI|nr:hypothetical protein FH972_026714 [Carpinus fangiana]